MRIIHLLIMWIVFMILINLGIIALELMEGYKIATTEYYGLRNIGFVFIMIYTMPAMAVFPVIGAPLTLLLHRIARAVWLRAEAYLLLGGTAGAWLFHMLYEDRFIREYELQISSAIVIFGVIGMIYGLIDAALERSAERKTRRPGGHKRRV